MKKSDASHGQSASELISKRIAELGDWRGDTLRRMRTLIKEADPDIVEEWKWMGTPTWSHDGIICTGESYKSVVKLTFAKGASLKDPARLFNLSLDGNVRRAIDIREGEKVDASAFKTLVRQAVALNRSTKSKSSKKTKGRLLHAVIGVVVLAGMTTAAQSEQELTARARAIHERVITLDTHNDIDPSHFVPACNYTMNLTTQVNLPKMRAGGLDVSFMVVYVAQSTPQEVPDAFQPSGYDRAYNAAVAKFDAIHRLTKEIAPNDIELALTAADVARIAKSGKKVAVIGIENGYPIGTEIKRVREFWDRGGRYMSLAHNGHSQLADSNTGEANNQWWWGGLSPLGRQVVAEMNKWGMMVDVSHLSKGAMMQAVGLSKAPVIASHSSVRTLANVSRNMDDEMLTAIKTNGGVVQIVAFSSYIKSDPPERGAAVNRLREEFGVRAGGGGGAASDTRRSVAPTCPVEGASPATTGRGGRGGPGVEMLTPDRRAEFERHLADIDRSWPPAARATVGDFVDAIDYAVRLIGIDHVGISSDFDGGGGIDGWNNAAETFNVTLELVRRGYTEEQIGKMWSGNVLRVWGEVERVAKDIQAGRR